MALPSGWKTVAVTGRWLGTDGQPCAGEVDFITSQVVVVDGVVVVPAKIVAELDASGAISVQLPATNDPDLDAQSWGYTVHENITPAGRSPYLLLVPYDSAGVDLATATPAVLTSSVRPVYALSIGAVSAGTDAAANLTDVSAGRQVLSLTLPRGPQGPQGQAGADGGGGGDVQSVNAKTGAVVLTATDVGAATSAQGALAGTALQPGDGLSALDGAAATKLGGVAAGAQVNVQADWDGTGAAAILHKPTIPTVPTAVSAFTNDAGYLTAHQSLTGYALTSQLFSGSYADLTKKPTIPTIPATWAWSAVTGTPTTLAGYGITDGASAGLADAPSDGTIYGRQNDTWVAVPGGGGGSGTGSVTSVALTVPGWLSVTGSPVTTAGTLAVSATAQAAGLVLAGPTSGSAAPAFRALVAADIPTLSYATTAQGAKADSAVQPSALADVATSGSYTDLTDPPSIPSVTTLPSSVVFGDFTLAPAQAGTILRVDSSVAATITVDASAVPAGSVFFARQTGAGQVTIAAAAGTTLYNAEPTLKLAGQYALAMIRVEDTLTAYVNGELATA